LEGKKSSKTNEKVALEIHGREERERKKALMKKATKPE